MAIPREPDNDTSNIVEISVDVQAGSSELLTSKKRLASISLSDAETLAAGSDTATTKMRTSLRSLETRKRKSKKRRRKQSVTGSILFGKSIHKMAKQGLGAGAESSKDVDSNEPEEANESAAQTVSVEPVIKDELAELRDKVGEQETSIKLHEQFLGVLASSLTCQICLEPMRRPWTLSPCGHTACYRCLIAWFRSPPQNIPQPPPEYLLRNFDPDDPTQLARGMRMLLKKDKTCPHCRAIVREAPVEAWGIKDIVSHLFNTSQGTLAAQVFPDYVREAEAAEAAAGSAEAGATATAQSSTNASEPSGADAWQGVFKPLHCTRRGHAHEGDRGFFDEDDGVHRCTVCYHEIWDGLCSSCGRWYPSLLDHDVDEDDDNYPWMDAHGFDEDGGVWTDEPDELHGAIFPRFINALARGAPFLRREQNADRDRPQQGENAAARGQHRNAGVGTNGVRNGSPRIIDEDDDDPDHEHDDDDEYESSFIDDEEDEAEIDEEIDEEEAHHEQYHSAEDEDENDGVGVRLRRSRRPNPLMVTADNPGSTPPRVVFVGGSSLHILSQSPPTVPRRMWSRPRSRSPRPPGALDLSSEGESDNDAEPASGHNFRSRARRWVAQIHSDHEDNEGEVSSVASTNDANNEYHGEGNEDPESEVEVRSVDENAAFERMFAQPYTDFGRYFLNNRLPYDDREMQFFSDDDGDGDAVVSERGVDDPYDYDSGSGASDYGDAYSDDPWS